MARTQSKDNKNYPPRPKRQTTQPTPRPSIPRPIRQPLFFGFDASREFWVLLALAAVLRILTLTRNAVWYDELMNYHGAQGSFGEILKSTVHWLHFIILRIGLSINDGVIGLRIFPLLFGIAAFPLFYATGNLLAKKTGAIAFALLFTVSQYHIFYSQDGNYYSEMMFYTIAAAYLAVAGMVNKRLWIIALFIIPQVLSFLTQPFSGLFSFFAIIAVAMAILLDAELRGRIFRTLAFWRQPSAKAFRTAAIFLLIVIGLIVANKLFEAKAGVSAFVTAQSMMNEALKGIRPGATAWNMELSPYFFVRTLREIGPSYIYDNILTQIASLFFFIFWIFGAIFIIRKRCWPALVFYVPFIGTYLFLFNFDPGRFFHIRYASYLCPLYLAGVALGGFEIARLIQSVMAQSEVAQAASLRSAAPTNNPLEQTISLAPQIFRSILPVALAVALTLPSLTAYYFRDGANWKKVASYLKPRLKSHSALIFYNEREGMQANFYAKQYDLPESALKPARNAGSRQQQVALSAIKQSVAAHPDSWFFSSWVEPTRSSGDASLLVSPIVTSWVQRNFQVVLNAPSAEEVNPIPLYRADLRKARKNSPPVQSAILYRWAYPNRYLYAPYPLAIDLTQPPALPNPKQEIAGHSSLLEVNTGQNGQSWSFPLLVETKGTYHIGVQGPAILPTSGILTIDWGNGAIQNFPDNQSYAALLHSTATVNLSPGLHKKVSIFWRAPVGERLHPISLKSLQISPAWDLGFSVPAMNFDYIPASETESGIAAGTPYLKIRGCRMARYRVNIDRSAKYQLLFQGARSKPAPIAVEVWIDDDLKGVLPFMEGKTNVWQKSGLPLDLAAGEHTLDFLFLQDLHDGDEESARNEFLLQSFSLEPWNQEKALDSRLELSNIRFEPPDFLRKGFEVLEPYSTDLPGPSGGAYWAEDPPNILQQGYASIEPAEGDHSPIVRLNGTPEHGPVNFRTRLFEVSPGELLHFSFRIRCENLYTHNANAQVWYFDSTVNLAQPLRKDWVNIEHLSGTAPWERWSYFDRAPEGTVFALVTFSIFNQGNPQWRQVGSAFFEDFKWSKTPDPSETK